MEAFAIIDTFFQWVGPIMIGVLGVAVGRHYVVYDTTASRTHRIRWTVLPTAPGATVGLTVGLMHF